MPNQLILLIFSLKMSAPVIVPKQITPMFMPAKTNVGFAPKL